MIDSKGGDRQLADEARRMALEARRADEARRAAEHTRPLIQPHKPAQMSPHLCDGFETAKPVRPFASIGLHGIAPGELHDIGRPDVGIPEQVHVGPPDVGIPEPVKPQRHKLDLDHNGKIDIRDLAKAASEWGKSGPGLSADFDGNNRVDMGDLNAVVESYGQRVPSIQHKGEDRLLDRLRWLPDFLRKK
jgi:hypothetical protein